MAKEIPLDVLQKAAQDVKLVDDSVNKLAKLDKIQADNPIPKSLDKVKFKTSNILGETPPEEDLTSSGPKRK